MIGNSSALTQLYNAFFMDKNHSFKVNAMEDQVFDFIHVTDAVDAVLKLTNLKFFPDPDKRVINIGSGEKSTLKQAAEYFEEIFERHLDVEYSEKRPRGIPLSLVVSCCRANTELGWKPSVKFEKGIKLLARTAFCTNVVK
jgi:nucleoside-diphosphate-sugar epimerase